MGSIRAFGDNVICREVDRKDDTIMGEVVSVASKRLKKGDIVFYSDRNYDNVHMAFDAHFD